MTIQSVCVDPAWAPALWPHVRPHIEDGIRRGGNLTDFPTLEHRVLCGKNLLWLAWDGDTILAAAVTSLDLANGKKFCTIVACGGHDLNLWHDLVVQIEEFARHEGCASVVIQGRRGWARVLTNYEPIATIMERSLAQDEVL